MESCTLTLWMHTSEHQFVLGWGPIQSMQDSTTCWDEVKPSTEPSSVSLTIRRPDGVIDSKMVDMATVAQLITQWETIAEPEQDLDLHW
ncbi:hypothetical protein [Vibrio variabilis]|uniref:hypothetical protein n=1 Tax=Vibrio variabilis TaxID=990271 RepID=UPI000DD8C573|nr:hypothetical protein [Vibrio variabilis]